MRYRPPGMATVAVAALASLAAASALSFSKPVQVRVDGQPVLTDVPPIAAARDVFVPVRPVGDALGAETHYTAKSGEVSVSRGDTRLHLRVGSVNATLGGNPMTLRHAPFRVRGRVMIGLGTLERAFGVRTRFDRNTARLDVDTPGVAQPSGTPEETQ